MDLYRINLNLLIALDALLQEASVTLSANKLFITQAAMSNNLQNLRQIFKDDLLIREKNHMVLTSYAKALQPKLHKVLEEIRTLIQSGEQFVPVHSERIFNIGMSDYMAVLILPELLKQLAKKAPNIKIAVVSLHHIASPDPFEKGIYDLGIGKIFEISNVIHKKTIFKDTGVVVLNRQHPLAKKSKITLKDYLFYKHIAVRAENPHFPPVIEQALIKLGFQRNIQICLPFITPIFELIESSQELIATVISSVTKFYKSSNLVIKKLPFAIPEIEFSIAWHKRHDNDAGHQWLRELLIEIGHKIDRRQD